jgi:excinuclease ABC subunit B
MPKPPKAPRNPAKHSKKDPARPTRAKAHRPENPAADPALDRLLNPGIERGTAGMGSGTGLSQPPDKSFERRAARRSNELSGG